MQAVTTIGLDIAKSVFQVHGVDAAGQVLIRRQLKRRAVLAFFQKLPVCLVGIEACAHDRDVGIVHKAATRASTTASSSGGIGSDCGMHFDDRAAEVVGATARPSASK